MIRESLQIDNSIEKMISDMDTRYCVVRNFRDQLRELIELLPSVDPIADKMISEAIGELLDILAEGISEFESAEERATDFESRYDDLKSAIQSDLDCY